jgi:hypothetical protein
MTDSQIKKLHFLELSLEYVNAAINNIIAGTDAKNSFLQLAVRDENFEEEIKNLLTSYKDKYISEIKAL